MNLDFSMQHKPSALVSTVSNNDNEHLRILMVPPPAVTLEDALHVAKEAYGWEAEAKLLTGERDKNFLLRLPNGDGMVLKFINAAETESETDLQIQVLDWLAKQHCQVATPKAIRTVLGQAVFDYPCGGELLRVRAYTFLDGLPILNVHTKTEIEYAFGQTAAVLVQALAGFDHPALSRVLLWDVMHVGQLCAWAHDLAADDAIKPFVLAFLHRFGQSVLPKLQALPQQVIHGDVSKSNTVVASADAVCIDGVLDFGDLSKAPRVVELAIAASYAIDGGADVEQALARVVAGYEATLPLQAAEKELLLDLVVARLVQRIVISEWRANKFPSNRDYILRSTEQARQLLAVLVQQA